MAHLFLGLLGTTEQTGSPGSNETDFLTLGSVPRHRRGLTNVLMVTTTVRLEIPLAPVEPTTAVETRTWSTGFMATPRVRGQQLRLAANLCLARDASVHQNQYEFA